MEKKYTVVDVLMGFILGAVIASLVIVSVANVTLRFIEAKIEHAKIH